MLDRSKVMIQTERDTLGLQVGGWAWGLGPHPIKSFSCWETFNDAASNRNQYFIWWVSVIRHLRSYHSASVKLLASFLAHGSPCGICDGQSGRVVSFSPCTSVFTCQSFHQCFVPIYYHSLVQWAHLRLQNQEALSHPTSNFLYIRLYCDAVTWIWMPIYIYIKQMFDIK
jgi:hypothetical protein